ncbi:hypothetical protein Goklo_025205 [Gossypium klotzschianum]|uniref:Uncharacterized protein n=1 Tax=Gossypium klotzschianum TaxID=34286 RepID=A0A7J8W971_9ROSI|nr:hypothetical protein [Gossypium klotzschianum]
MLEKFLPHAMLKARANLELRIRTLKKEQAIIYDMLRGKDNNSFGWQSICRWLLLKMRCGTHI